MPVNRTRESFYRSGIGLKENSPRPFKTLLKYEFSYSNSLYTGRKLKQYDWKMIPEGGNPEIQSQLRDALRVQAAD